MTNRNLCDMFYTLRNTLWQTCISLLQNLGHYQENRIKRAAAKICSSPLFCICVEKAEPSGGAGNRGIVRIRYLRTNHRPLPCGTPYTPYLSVLIRMCRQLNICMPQKVSKKAHYFSRRARNPCAMKPQSLPSAIQSTLRAIHGASGAEAVPRSFPAALVLQQISSMT